MSLLMEALRKAELEKKKAAQRLEETIEQSNIPENTGGHRIVPARPPDVTNEQPITRMDPTYIRSREELLAATSSLSLAPIEIKPAGPAGATGINEDVTLNIFMDDTPGTADEIGNRETASGTDATLNQEVMPEPMLISGDTPMVEPLHEPLAEITSKLPGIYDETVQGEAYQAPERSYDETLPGVSAVELARDLGEVNQPTPVAAQTIFTATATAQPAIGYKWPLIFALTAVALVVFGFIIYQTQTPLVREIPQDQMVGDLDLSRIPAPVTDAAITPATTVAAAGQAPESVPSDQALTAGIDTQAQPAAAPAESTAAEAPAGVQPIADSAPAAATPAPEVAAMTPAPAPAGQTAGKSPEAIELEPGLIKISRSKAPEGKGLEINDAYGAYQRGDFAGAGRRYAEVLRDYPDNRDALLGLGAIAVKSGDMVKAQEIYSRLFRLNPGDNYARAVLVSLDNITDPVSRESALKIMIQDNPDSAFLHFSLGNVYAAQSRWAEAQQAFFDAYSNESDNADYALNLAVSLDHIGQARAALDYYHTAMQLADERPAQFDSARILARIQVLTSNNIN